MFRALAPDTRAVTNGYMSLLTYPSVLFVFEMPLISPIMNHFKVLYVIMEKEIIDDKYFQWLSGHFCLYCYFMNVTELDISKILLT